MRADLYGELYELEATHFWHRAKRELVLQILARTSVHRTLELGCGAGLLLEEMTRIGFDAWGSDASEDALAFCRRRGLERVFAHDAETPLDWSGPPFDAVLALDLIEHLDDDVAALRQVHGVLAPEGLLLLHVPAHASLFGYWDEMLHHRRRYARADLERVLGEAGFEPRQISPSFGWLLPPAAAFRKLRGLLPRGRERSDFRFSSATVNAVGEWLCSLERDAAIDGRLPFGLSWLVVAGRAPGL
jgi:SAM-dependent methyltransferase